MNVSSIPKDLRGLRACLMCSLIKSTDQFEREGCDNCDEFLNMKHNIDNVIDCTSKNFEGMISMLNPGDSWVAKWQRIDHFCKGVYAISVSGRLPGHISKQLRSRGIRYKNRDTSQK